MRPAKILIIEDNPLTRKLFRVTLESAGYAVIESPNGKTAIELAATECPDLILQDLILPDIQGFELLQTLRALPAGPKIPILAVSGLIPKIEEAKTMGIDFTDFLVKPVEPSLLIQRIQAYLPSGDLDTMRPGQGYRILIVDDDAIQRKLMNWQFSHLGFEVTLAEDGKQALEMALRSPPDAIVSDVLMPGLDGFMLCLEIRRHPSLAQLPVILTSAVYISDEDRKLAMRTGANAYVPRTPDYREIIALLLEALRTKRAPPKPIPPPEILTMEHRYRVIRQLERQASTRMDLSRAFAVQAAQLSILAGASDVFTRTRNIDKVLEEVLYLYLDATSEISPFPTSMGAIYLLEPDGRLKLKAQLGFSPTAQQEFFEFSGYTDFLSTVVGDTKNYSIPSEQIPMKLGNELLRRAGAKTLVLMPLIAGGERLGVIVIASQKNESGIDLITFAKAMSGQLSQAIALARALYKIVASERKAQEALQLRDEFLLMISHELRTPLTSLKLRIQTILASIQGNDPTKISNDEIRMLLKSADQQVSNLSELIDKLLSVSRVSIGKLQFYPENIDLLSLIRKVVKQFELELKASGSSLELDLDGEIIGRWDRLLLEQIIRNLLSNAIVYGGGGPVKISARASGDHMVLTVEDRGIGIAIEDQSRIFERFERAVSNWNFGGLGLGLYLTRQIVEGHSGSIRVESLKGKGSKFIVELPLRPVEAIYSDRGRKVG